MLANVIRMHRLRLGLTQDELATGTGLSARHLRDLEAGRITAPRQATLRLLADAFALQGDERERFYAAARSEGKAVVGPGPAQLPRDVDGFAGRCQEIDQLDALLTRSRDRGATVVISAVCGAAGVGKTALALHWSHRVRRDFPDGQLYVNLRGFDPDGAPMTPGEAVRGFLDVLDVPAKSVPADLPQQSALYRSVLAGRRMLILLDNASDAAQVRPLLPASAGCLVVVTSRNQLTGLIASEGAHPLNLDLLTPAEAEELLVHRLGKQRVAAEPEATDEIIIRCARLPLALTIVAARAAMHPGFTLAALAAQLRQTTGTLDAFAVEDAVTDVRTVFSWSYQRLSDPAAKLFRLLGSHRGPDLSAPAAASLTGVGVEQVSLLLAELAHACLVTEHTPSRYTLHDLLRSYASELGHAGDNPETRSAAIGRLFDHYLHSGVHAALLVDPQRDPITPTPHGSGVTPETMTGRDEAMEWFAAERPTLLAAVCHAADAGEDTHTWQLAWTLVTFLDRSGHWHDWVAVQQAALAAASRLGELGRQADAHRSLAVAFARLGRDDEAHDHHRCALAGYEALGDHLGQAHTHHVVAQLHVRVGQWQEALSHTERALHLHRQIDHLSGQARALNNIGWLQAQLGDHRMALTYCEQALALHCQIGDRSGEAATRDSLGQAHAKLGNHEQAAVCYHHALTLMRDLGLRYQQADTLHHLGDSRAEVGDSEAAHDIWRQALAIFEQLGHEDAEAVRAKVLRASI
ncbi:hypothetical protein Rhe02_07580 [Rhizocola hellebori]|uniref:HTH cro/C1-type domain-containing protein n=1 Tax=Rhizocola hellebori TaxID=1392758 RepID=A0A8J3Q3G3_9ACTN|nr:hypothetical protein Rhe02_07580 [Rhizocola hellebori]